MTKEGTHMKRPVRRKLPRWVNAKGEVASAHTVPPDLKRCQACPNMLSWSPFTLGPRPKPERCTNRPYCVAVENKSAVEDGKIGSMALCTQCLALFRKVRPPTFAKIHVIS